MKPLQLSLVVFCTLFGYVENTDREINIFTTKSYLTPKNRTFWHFNGLFLLPLVSHGQHADHSGALLFAEGTFMLGICLFPDP